ncbi:MAG TPA: hypothetical protein VER17_20955 [Tepidisphaeraceae bacterium]|nr:hypothetical protein [Tepidisphaeraceae bacterium]
MPETQPGFTHYWVGGAVLIVGLYQDKGLGRLLYGNPIAMWLGNGSYALYLVHATPILWSMYKVYPHTAWSQLPLFVMVGIALAVSAVIYDGFQRPARTWLRSLALSRRRAQDVPAAAVP